MVSSSNKKFWENKWNTKNPPFHNEKISYALEKYGQIFFKPNDDVFVPLCGKTVDLIYLKNRVRSVTGIEIIEKAVTNFFEENQIPFKKVNHTYNSGSLRILNEDIFKFKTEQKFDVILDRASLIALPIEIRNRYYKVLIDLLSKHGKIILTTIYKNDHSGPPYMVSKRN